MPTSTATCMPARATGRDRKSTRLNSSHLVISYAVFCLKKNMKRAPVIGAALVLVACRLSDHLGAPSLPDQPVQLVVAPESVALDPYQTQQFRASGRTAAGDSMPVTVSWTASAGPVTQSGLYTADTSVADVLVTATYSATGTAAATSSAGQLSGTSRVKKKR